MKILMLSDFYPPVIGGLERHVQLLSEGLTKRGHKVTVCTIGHKRLPDFKVENDVKVLRLRGFFQRIPFLFKDSERKHHPPIKDWMVTKELEKIIEMEKPDIIHVHGLILYSILPLREKNNIPLVVTLHDYGFFCPKRTLLTNNVERCKPLTKRCIICGRENYGLMKSFFAYYGVKLNKNKLKFVDKFIAVSPFVKDVHSKHLNLVKEISIVPNFHEMEKRNLKLKEAGTFPNDFILFVGALSSHKGVDSLINAYNRLNTETSLVLIGRTDADHSYNSTENRMIIENARYETVMEAYSKSRFVIIPSIWPDPCPTAAFEAMSCKKAIIASDIGGLSDIIVNRKTGILVPFNNSKKLAEAIDYLLKRPSRANEMGENGFKRFKRNYASSIIVPKIERVYTNLCNKSD